MLNKFFLNVLIMVLNIDIFKGVVSNSSIVNTVSSLTGHSSHLSVQSIQGSLRDNPLCPLPPAHCIQLLVP